MLLRHFIRRLSSEASPLSHEGFVQLERETTKSDWKRRQGTASFVDSLMMTAVSGHGGQGGVAFHREKYVAFGPPSGGQGGKGGDVYIRASANVTSLGHLARTVKAGAGGAGGGKWLTGKRGEDAVIEVPVGTILRELPMQTRQKTAEDSELNDAEQRELENAWEVCGIRLKEAMAREVRWDKWKAETKRSGKAGKGNSGEKTTKVGPFQEEPLLYIAPEKEADHRRLRNKLFVTYPSADIDYHPQFLRLEYETLAKILDRSAQYPGKKRKAFRHTPARKPLYLDLAKESEPILLLKGGEPGLGNASFQSTDDRSPKYALRGSPGESMRISLELKAGGDVGLVGVPNAGKSTLLRALTHSRPRVAAYAFTTLNPHHGTCVVYADGSHSGPEEAEIADTPSLPRKFSANERKARDAARDKDIQNEVLRFTITDNPGLISLSSQNVGLGHAFLRHLERCPVLLYVIDVSQTNALSPEDQLTTLKQELDEYSSQRLVTPSLSDKIRGVVFNKADQLSAENGPQIIKNMSELVTKSLGPDVWTVTISASHQMNTQKLIERLVPIIEEQRAREKEEPSDTHDVGVLIDDLIEL